MKEDVLKIACEKAREEGQDPDSYDIEIVEEPMWVVNFLPKVKGGFGGGFRIEIGKDDLEVRRVAYYQ